MSPLVYGTPAAAARFHASGIDRGGGAFFKDEMSTDERIVSSTGPPRRIWVFVLLAVFSAGALWLATRSGEETNAGPNDGLRRLPAFSLRGFDGQTFTNQALAGRPAVINFFASTCAFCIDEMPAFERVHGRVGNGVAFLGVALRDSDPAARRLARETGVTYPLAFDDSGSFYRALRAFGMPVTAFVLRDGRIALLHAGPLNEAQLQRAVDGLLAG